MLKRYVGPDDEVKVVVAGTEIGNVKRGEAIAVPDDIAGLTVWPDTLWQDGAEDKKTASKKTATPTDSAAPSQNESDK